VIGQQKTENEKSEFAVVTWIGSYVVTSNVSTDPVLDHVLT
jgi:hypothetical protein